MDIPEAFRPPAALMLLALVLLLMPGKVGAQALTHLVISSQVTSLYSGQSTTLTASWNGGTPPYSLTWYTGTSQSCGLDTAVVQTAGGLASNTHSVLVTPPPGGAFYCITVADSSSPPASISSSPFGIVVQSGAPPSSTSVPPTTSAQQTVPTSTVPAAPETGGSFPLCNIVNTVRSIVGILALTLFLLGGVLYAVSHFLPTNMEFKKSLSAWAVAMIAGGIIGLVIVLMAQPLISVIIGAGNAAGGSVSSVIC